MYRRSSYRLKRRVKAVIAGSCAGAVFALFIVAMASLDLSGLADNAVDPAVCTGHAIIVTTFAPDIHC